MINNTVYFILKTTEKEPHRFHVYMIIRDKNSIFDHLFKEVYNLCTKREYLVNLLTENKLIINLKKVKLSPNWLLELQNDFKAVNQL